MRRLIDDRLKGKNHKTEKSGKTEKKIFVHLKAKKCSFALWLTNKKKETERTRKNLVIDDVRMKRAEGASWAQQLDKRFLSHNKTSSTDK